MSARYPSVILSERQWESVIGLLLRRGTQKAEDLARNIAKQVGGPLMERAFPPDHAGISVSDLEAGGE